jgi:hypothetical protein
VKQIYESASDEDVLSGGAPVGILDDRQTAASAGGVSREAGITRRTFERRISVHEAGHAVASFVLLTVAGSTIEFVNGHHGCTWSNESDLEPGAETVADICAALKPLMPGMIDTELEQAHSHVIAWLAGVEAEKLFCDASLLPNTGHDLAAARAVAALIVRDVADVDSYIEFGRGETRALLTKFASAVIAIANALVEHRTLNSSQIESIVRAGLANLNRSISGVSA